MSPTVDSSARTIGRRRFLHGAAVLGAAVAIDQLPLTRALAASRLYKWSSPRTWGGRVPGPRDVAHINKAVVLDVAARVAGIVIEPGGSLVFDPGHSLTLRSKGNIIVKGRLEMRPSSPSNKHRIIFVDVNERGFQGKSADPLRSDVGLWVMGRGVLAAVGADKLAWTRAAGSVARGATQVTLSADPVGWNVGDEVSITPTIDPNDGGQAEAFDLVKVTAINGRTVTLSRPTVFAHPEVAVGLGKTFSAEVLNLTRNVMIEGTQDGKAHIFMRSSKPQTLKSVAVRYLGPRKPSKRNRGFSEVILARWPVHFHHAMGGSRGSVISGVVARDVGSHAYVAHMSHGVKFQNCIAYNALEDPYWWDTGDPTNDTLFDRCVAAKVNTRSKDKMGNLYGFVMGLGFGNTARNCVATGVMGNAFSDTGGFGWIEKNGGLWTFEDNVSHNNRNNGLFNWLNAGEVHRATRFVAYRNGKAGVELGAYENRNQFDDCALSGNTHSVILHVVSKEAPKMTFRNCNLDGNILIPRRLGGQAGAPTLFTDSNFKGKITVDHRNSVGSDTAGLYDFVRLDLGGRDLEPDDFNLIHLHPGSRIRVQRKNDTAYEFNELKIPLPIPPFA